MSGDTFLWAFGFQRRECGDLPRVRHNIVHRQHDFSMSPAVNDFHRESPELNES